MSEIQQEADEFKEEVLLFEAIANEVLDSAKGKLAAKLFAWAHAKENPARCTKNHHADYSKLWGKNK